MAQLAADNDVLVTLAATKTHPSDVVLADLRALRAKANKAALSGKLGAYYMTDRKLVSWRAHVLSAARVRENWFLVSPSIDRAYPEAEMDVNG